MENKTAVDDFLADIPRESQQTVDELLTPEKAQEVVKEPEEELAKPRDNRETRRLREQLQRERETGIALAERVKVLSEVKSEKIDTSTLDSRLARLFGTTDEGKQVAQDFSSILAERDERIKEDALREFEARQAQEKQAQTKYEEQITSQLEAIEDEYDVDLTSSAPAAKKARMEFLDLVQKLSPKNEDGELAGYADFNSTFEIYKQTKQKPDASRNKELASRTMKQSGSVNSDKAADDANLNYLRSIGLKV